MNESESVLSYCIYNSYITMSSTLTSLLVFTQVLFMNSVG